MKGNFKLKKINKKTGESEVILEEKNQVAAGFATAITNILTSTGSRDKNDYMFRYFQVGDDNYNLSSYGVSADVPEDRLKSQVWTMKSPLDISSYGRDSILPVVQRGIYGLGSIRPYWKDKVFDNFIDPPDTTNQLAEYTNNFQNRMDPEPHGNEAYTQQKTTWVVGCASAWEGKRENYFHYPLWVSAVDPAVSGPTLTSPTYVVQYNGSADISDLKSSCIKVNTDYQNHKGLSKSMPPPEGSNGRWNLIKKDQTVGVYVTTDYWASSTMTKGTPITGAIQLQNTASQSLVSTEAALNKVTFQYRYNLTVDSTHGDAEWYPPYILHWGTGTGYDLADSSVKAVWESIYGTGVSGGTVSGNVECSAGEMYIYGGNGVHGDVVDANGDLLDKPYSTMQGPGYECSGQPNSGFGPSGTWYRVTNSWMDVPDSVINYNDGVYKGGALQSLNYPIYSSLHNVASREDWWGNSTTVEGNQNHVKSPMSRAYWANTSIEYGKRATPYQYIHAESPYYITTPQYFLQIPEGYTTSLNDDTINVRLFLDEYLANGKTLKEVALFLKNPGGQGGEDAPFMCGYKVLDPPLEKNSEFSYIIDWELSVVDTDNL